jgi:transcriptional regulator with GAF, ATPase, and Fis domain
VSKFDLRDVSERLARSRDTEAVVFEFLGYLQSVRGDWRASLAFYEVSQDAFVTLYQRNGGKLVKRDLKLPVDQLPARLVRKFFHPSAFFNHTDRRSILAQLLQSSPAYEPDPVEAPLLRPLIAQPNWQSSVCLALADQDDVIGLLVLASEKRNAFGSRAVGELIPIKSIASMAIAQHLHRARAGAPVIDERATRLATSEFQDRIRRLTQQTQELEEDNRHKAERLSNLNNELVVLEASSNEYRKELERVQVSLAALEEQTSAATVHLNEAYTELTSSQTRLQGLEDTMSFLKDVFHVLATEHDSQEFPRTLVHWFCERFGLERVSLMTLDGGADTLKIAAHCGMDPDIVGQVRVRVGQGVSGWVAHHRKPLFVRAKPEGEAPHTGKDVYNSDSFISVPLIYDHRLFGVLNLSNKRDGEPFDDLDFDRAQMAAGLVALTLGGRNVRNGRPIEGLARELEATGTEDPAAAPADRW